MTQEQAPVDTRHRTIKQQFIYLLIHYSENDSICTRSI